MKTVIKRCPLCTDIRAYADRVAATLYQDLGIQTEMADGEKGEFSVYVDNRLVLQKERDGLLEIAKVKEAVEKAKSVSV
jgi:hypothetical protein